MIDIVEILYSARIREFEAMRRHPLGYSTKEICDAVRGYHHKSLTEY